MKSFHKLACIFFIIVSMTLAGVSHAKSASIDTALIFYKNNSNGYTKVNTKDSCDFVRVVFPNDSTGKGFIIHDYYKSGKMKLLGRTTPRYVTNVGSIEFDGDCITYFENGKRQSMAHYVTGNKDGDEYLFYPDGKIYAIIKYTSIHNTYTQSAYWECYDPNGTMICNKGNGRWINYNKDFTNVSTEGPVKKGTMDGEWHGGAMVYSDSIKYIYQYKNGIWQSAKSFDKTGKEYSFSTEIAPAYYWNGPFNFLRTVQSHLKLPKDTNGKKMSADDVFVSFIIEKDGHISNLEMLTVVDPVLKNAIADAFSKCGMWTPRKNYGVPVRAKITLSLKYVTHSSSQVFTDEIFYGEQQINDQ
jgi:antitoxin component YwqK of YwqJK toxin-antitoxin module